LGMSSEWFGQDLGRREGGSGERCDKLAMTESFGLTWDMRFEIEGLHGVTLVKEEREREQETYDD